MVLLYYNITYFQKLNINENERAIVIDLRPYMNSAPYIVRLVSTSLYYFHYQRFKL